MVTVLVLIGVAMLLLGGLIVLAQMNMPMPDNSSANFGAICFILGIVLVVFVLIFHSHLPTLGHVLGAIP